MSKLSITAGVATAALLAMSPAAALAQENTANTAYAAEPAASDVATDPAANAADATAADSMATEPMATTTADPMAMEPMEDPVDENRGGRSFPWGLLGLLGLVGLLGSKRSQ